MLQQWAELLDEFRGLPPRLKPLPTFLEFSGCKRKEEVYSDILAFYLDPGKPHGLGTLFLDALAQAGGIPNHGPWTGVSVEREKRTHNGNRIDILIESDNHVIVIENKIFAPVDNPFDDYKSFAETLEPPSRRIHVFLLTLTYTVMTQGPSGNSFCPSRMRNSSSKSVSCSGNMLPARIPATSRSCLMF